MLAEVSFWLVANNCKGSYRRRSYPVYVGGPSDPDPDTACGGCSYRGGALNRRCYNTTVCPNLGHVNLSEAGTGVVRRTFDIGAHENALHLVVRTSAPPPPPR